MKLAVVCEIRDEQDIVCVFFAHLKALFEMIFIVDHRSADSTKKYLEVASQSDGVSIYRLTTTLPHQTKVAKLLCDEAFSKGADFVFFLDADEFIDIPSRAALEKLLESSAADIPELKWTNAIAPENVKDESILLPSSHLKVAVGQSRWGKVVLSKQFYSSRKDQFELSRGIHYVSGTEGKRIESETIGSLVHLPIRSHGQLARKLVQRGLNYMCQTDLMGDDGWHYFQVLEALANSSLTKEQLFYLSIRYAEPWSGQGLSQDELSLPEFVPRTLTSLALDMDFFETMNAIVQVSEVSLLRLFALTLRNSRAERNSQMKLMINNGQIIAARDKDEALPEVIESELDIRLLREQNRFLHSESMRVQIAAESLISEVAKLEGERSQLLQEADRLEHRLKESKQLINQQRETIDQLQYEIDHRGTVLDKKRAELADARATSDELRKQLTQNSKQT
jgi:Glycosyl transferase family 2